MSKKFEQQIGDKGFEFLVHALTAIDRLLPHTETTPWKLTREKGGSRVWWASTKRRTLNLRGHLTLNNSTGSDYTLSAILTRKQSAGGVGKVARTIDDRERDLCERVLKRLSTVLQANNNVSSESLLAIRGTFDEQIVASHLRDRHRLQLDVEELLRSLRGLAEQSYENKSLTFGCLLDPNAASNGRSEISFPSDFFEWKRYKALSDGYRTAYRVSKQGRVIGFHDLRIGSHQTGGTHYYPEWCEYLANNSTKGVCGICLTRQGDILVFDGGTLRFTYRFGRWQYWNHTHVIDILRNRARVQRVPEKEISRVVGALYRAALDVSFSRSGGLFVLLRNRASLSKIVAKGDAIKDKHRKDIHKAFDTTLSSPSILTTHRRLVVELAGLDGAIVLNNKGAILAYSAILRPERRGRVSPAEGSRTKAAIGASNYGLAIKISSDGEMSFYADGERYLVI